MEANLKRIVVNGIELDYQLCYHSSEYGESEWTEFYIGTRIIARRKYRICGPIVTYEIPNKVFMLNFSIENEHYTKKEVRSKIERKLELLNRKAEIERGEII
jgi:hypothetical protein